MTTRLVRVWVFLLACPIFLPHTGTKVAELSQQATVATEPSGPKPSATVEKMLEEASRLAEAKQPLDSLKAADQALELSRKTNDAEGIALAEEARAKALQDLQRPGEAVTAWQEAAKVRAGLGDTSGQIRAWVHAGLLCVSDKRSEAEKFFAQGLSIGKSETQHPEVVAQALHESGVALNARRQTQPAWETQVAWDYLRAALAIWEKQPPDSLMLAKTLNALTQVAIERGDDNDDTAYYTMGRDYAARAAEIGRRLAPESSIVAESLYLLGHTEWGLSSYGASLEHELAALRIQRKLAPDGSMEEVRILTRLGKLEDEQTNFAMAHQYLQEAAAIGERLAPVSMQYEQSLEGLGIEEISEGDLPRAREHLQGALAIKEELHGAPASTLINLGVVASDQYDFASALDYFERALAGYASSNPNAYGVVVALANLRDTFLRQGDLATALEYSRRVLAIEKDKLVDIYTAEDLSVMGDILREQGQFTAAADYYQQALDIREKLAPGSFHVSESLVALAKLARAQQNISLAMGYDRRALLLAEKSCPNSWCVAAIVNDLGELAYAQGDLAGSESYLRRAVDIREQSLGPGHPDLARSLNNLALAVAALGRTPEALEIALQAERIGAEHLRVSVRTLSERQALAYESVRASGLDLALTLAGERETQLSARGEVFDAVIRSRALVFDELAARHRSVYKSGDPEVTQLADQLLSARTRLATLVFRGVGDMEPRAYRNLLDETRAQKEKAERALAEKSIAFRQDQARTQIGLKEIAASLPQGAALVAFVRYNRHDLHKPRAGQVVPAPVCSYAAFVLRAADPEPVFVQLGAAREIETRLAAWRRDIARQADAPDVSARAGEDLYIRSGAALRRRIWDPLVPALGDARAVFVVPDAALHLVNLDSLPSSSSQYLIETGPLIHYLSTERDMVPIQSRRGEGILVVGNPAFDQSGRITLASDRQSTPIGAATTVLLRGSRSGCGTFQTLHFPLLPASQQEADNIAALWKRSTAGEPLQMTGVDASPQAFERYAPGKRVLHVATHGFFLEGSCQSAVQLRLDANKQGENSLPATAENPLLLSGLAFAGANRRGSAKPDEPDGILTAEEIAGINLEGVEWAVLSACDTGVGEIKVGEGVFGLRRAFQVAGAKTVIMSLWSVEDETTRQWMGTLYREHFLNGKDTGESVRAASLRILRQRRAKHQSTHPFYWGAFIAAGDWH